MYRSNMFQVQETTSRRTRHERKVGRAEKKRLTALSVVIGASQKRHESRGEATEDEVTGARI